MWQNIYDLDNLLNLAGDFVDIKQGTQILDKVVARNSFDESNGIQGPPTLDGFFECDISGTQKVVTSHVDGPNFSKHLDI